MEKLGDDVLIRIFELTDWNHEVIASLACVSRRFAELSRTQLWPRFCISHPSQLTQMLSSPKEPNEWKPEGGWPLFAKLMAYCPGKRESYKWVDREPVFGGHVDDLETQFSLDRGRKLLDTSCKMDEVFVTQACEHFNDEQDISTFRGIIKNFSSSKTKKRLTAITEKTDPQEDSVVCSNFEEHYESSKDEQCPFCQSEVWDARAVMSANACTVLQCYMRDYGAFICLTGHFYGMCAQTTNVESDSDIDAGDFDEEHFPDYDDCDEWWEEDHVYSLSD